MPNYDFYCPECGHRYIQFQEMTAEKLRKCPVCGKLKLIRLIGAGASVLFKGEGFPGRDLQRKREAEKWKR